MEDPTSGTISQSHNLRHISLNVFFLFSRGIRNSHIYYNSTDSEWKLQSLRHPDKIAYISDSFLPLGTHKWQPDICMKEPTQGSGR